MDLLNNFIVSVNKSSNAIAHSEGGMEVDFSFFSKDDAKKIEDGTDIEATPKKKKTSKPKVAINGEVLPDRDLANPVPGASVAEMDYARSYNETNNLIRGAIVQADELSAEIKQDIDTVRSSKTIKNKYTYVTNLTASASNLISTKIAAIKELNNAITQGHNLELNRLKALKLDQSETNDDMKMMDMYTAFINTPIGTYTPNAAPSVQDLTLGVNSQNGNISNVDLPGAVVNNGQNQVALTPEQNRMRMEANPNIQTVVRYDQATGQRFFDVIDSTNGMSIPNYPRPDNFLLEDTTIDIHAGIARNRNINTVWPLIVEGSNILQEY